VDEVELPRPLVRGEIAPAQFKQIRFGDAVIPPGDESDRDLAPFLIPGPDDGNFADAAVAHQNALDLGRVDVLSAGLDHVFDAVDEIERAIRVAPEYVA